MVSPPGRDQWKQPLLHHRTEELQTSKPGSLGTTNTIHPGRWTAGTYSHHPWKERKMIFQTSREGHVPSLNLQVCIYQPSPSTVYHRKNPSKNAEGTEVESTQAGSKGHSTGVEIQKFQCHFPQLELLAHRNGRIHHDLPGKKSKIFMIEIAIGDNTYGENCVLWRSVLTCLESASLKGKT